MLTPQTAMWLAGRALPNEDREAQQLADLRAAQAKFRRSPIERLQAYLETRSQAPDSDADCRD